MVQRLLSDVLDQDALGTGCDSLNLLQTRAISLKTAIAAEGVPPNSGLTSQRPSLAYIEGSTEELSAIWTPHFHQSLHAPLPSRDNDFLVLHGKHMSWGRFGAESYGRAGKARVEQVAAGGQDMAEPSPASGPRPRASHAGRNNTLADVWASLYNVGLFRQNHTGAQIVGVGKNTPADLKAFELALGTNAAIMITVLFCFTFFLRFRFPMIYQNNVEAEFAPRALGDGYFSWLVGSCTLTIDEVADNVSLDGAMLLEFTHLGMKVMSIIAIPMLFIMGPLDAYFGGEPVHFHKLSTGSIDNLVPGDWLFWVYMCIVWVVAIVVVQLTWSAKLSFIRRRFKWLRAMPKPQSTTLMVEGIPEDCRSDQALKSYFEQMFGVGKVLEAFVVKRLPGLENAVHAKTEAEKGIHSSTFQLKVNEMLWGLDPTQDGSLDSSPVVSVRDTLHQLHLQKNREDFKRDLEEAEQAIDTQSALMERVAPITGGVNTGVGFVTFSDRHTCEMARYLKYTENAYEWRLGYPPEPQSVRWDDLKSNPECTTAWQILGYVILLVLYVAYLPIVTCISVFCTSIDMGPLEPLWQAFAPSAGLTFVVSFLPLGLSTIARHFFKLDDEALAQHKLQTWDFWFQVTYVLLVTAVGTSVAGFLKGLAKSPLAIFHILAVTLPWSSHFYANYLVMSMTFEVLNLWRYANLFKYIMLSRIYESEVARSLAEPEDQNYWGIGARSTNFVIYFNIGLIFSCLCPIVTWVAFVMFVMLRLTYGYLIPFAETKKPDQGGIFWVSQLQHIFIGLEIFCVLMTGVLLQQADSRIPGLLCTPSMFYVGYSLHWFNNSFNWYEMPWEEIVNSANDPIKVDGDHQYVQPEILAVQGVCHQCGAHLKLADSTTSFPCKHCSGGGEDTSSMPRQQGCCRRRTSIFTISKEQAARGKNDVTSSVRREAPLKETPEEAGGEDTEDEASSTQQ